MKWIGQEAGSHQDDVTVYRRFRAITFWQPIPYMCIQVDSQAGRQTDIVYPAHLGLMGRMILSDSGTTLMLRKRLWGILPRPGKVSQAASLHAWLCLPVLDNFYILWTIYVHHIFQYTVKYGKEQLHCSMILLHMVSIKSNGIILDNIMLHCIILYFIRIVYITSYCKDHFLYSIIWCYVQECDLISLFFFFNHILLFLYFAILCICIKLHCEMIFY